MTINKQIIYLDPKSDDDIIFVHIQDTKTDAQLV